MRAVFSCYCCGQEATWSGDHHALCDGCHFRHTVMKAAGREEEFWEAHKALPEPNIPGWVSYKVKFTSSVPDTVRMRRIEAGESTT